MLRPPFRPVAAHFRALPNRTHARTQRGFSYGMLPVVPLYAAHPHPEVIQLGITLYATG